jgi:hypothetical protein
MGELIVKCPVLTEPPRYPPDERDMQIAADQGYETITADVCRLQHPFLRCSGCKNATETP